MPEPETNRPGERSDEDFGSPELNGRDPTIRDRSAESAANPSPEEADASEAAAAPGPDPVEKGPEELGEAGLSEFANDVVSGLEHAGLGAEEGEAFDQDSEESGSGSPGTSETFFAEWGSFGTGQPSVSSAHRPEESFIHPDSPAPSLNALSRMNLAGYAEPAGTQAWGTGKHEELADAVQSALFSIYGETAYQSAGRDYPNADTGDGASSSMDWSKGLKADFARQAGDGLSPEDVILNYFDYSPGGNGSAQGSAQSAYGRPYPDEGQAPQYVRSRPEPGAAQQRNWSAQDYSAYRADRVQGETNAAHYDGRPPYSFPVPAAAPASGRPGGRTGQESSKLLGAAAIGLMGGIAIAASLAAFLIYGPRPASVEIPGIGNLRLDKDEQGYGQGGLEEAGREPPRKSAPEFSSEMLAADMAVTPGQPSPISINIRPQPSERSLVSISGLPEGGRLNAGVDTGGGNWLLPPRRLSGLMVNLPVGGPDVIPIQVQLLDSNARTPLSAKAEFVIRVRSANLAALGAPVLAPRPAQSPAVSPAPRAQPAPPESIFKTGTETVPPPLFPPSQASPIPSAPPAVHEPVATRRTYPRPEVEDLIREGNKRMREGDIIEARQFYQKAVALGDAAGDAEAALAMGRSYDPIYFARIDKKNAEPDAAKAFDWYRRAMDAGAAQTAMVRIENLKHFLNE